MRLERARARLRVPSNRLHDLPFEDLGYARLDHHRALRTGFPEVVFCEGKRVDQIVEILQKLTRKHSPVLARRASREVYEAVAKSIPSAKYFDDARMIQLGINGAEPSASSVLVVCALWSVISSQWSVSPKSLNS